jgi:hypothetical protein
MIYSGSELYISSHFGSGFRFLPLTMPSKKLCAHNQSCSKTSKAFHAMKKHVCVGVHES